MKDDGSADPALKHLSQTWDAFGEVDAMWAISSLPDKLGGKWDPEEFFATGRAEIDALMAQLHALGAPERFSRCLDFGCGIGRLSRALAHYCDRVVGVDIAPSMIERAKRLNPDANVYDWRLNQRPNLELLESESFDFIYTNLVLQHMRPRIARSYVAEFFRIARRNAWIVFSLPDSETQTFKRRMENALRNWVAPALPRPMVMAARRKFYPNAPDEVLADLPFMQMFGIGRREVTALVGRLGGRVEHVDVGEDHGEGWVSARYYARKQ